MRTRKFEPKKSAPLEVVYITKGAKAWVKEQADKHGVSMVAVVDEMVDTCKTIDKKEQ